MSEVAHMSKIEELEESLKHLTFQSIDKHPTKSKEELALDFFRVASEKEKDGLLNDAIGYYRKAYRLDAQVDKRYREHLFSEAPPPEVRKDGSSVHPLKPLDISKINVPKLLESFQDSPIFPQDETKPLYLNLLPDEVIVNIMSILAARDTPAWFEFSRSCKRLAYLGFHESTIWRELCCLIYPKQWYDEESVALNNITKDQHRMVSVWDYNWHMMLKSRPFVKFNGIYISCVNYQSEGGRPEFSGAWFNPIRIITYYRYYRFYPDGTCLKLQTVLDPKKVVPKFHKNWRELFNGSEWESVYEGRWSMTLDGIVKCECNGPVDVLEMVDEFQIINGGRSAISNKLSWLAMKYRHRVSTEEGHFGFQNERNFVFSRVKSYYADKAPPVEVDDAENGSGNQDSYNDDQESSDEE